MILWESSRVGFYPEVKLITDVTKLGDFEYLHPSRSHAEAGLRVEDLIVRFSKALKRLASRTHVVLGWLGLLPFILWRLHPTLWVVDGPSTYSSWIDASHHAQGGALYQKRATGACLVLTVYGRAIA